MYVALASRNGVRTGRRGMCGDSFQVWQISSLVHGWITSRVRPMRRSSKLRESVCLLKLSASTGRVLPSRRHACTTGQQEQDELCAGAAQVNLVPALVAASQTQGAAQRSEFEFAISTPAGPAMPPTHEMGDFQSGHRSAFQSASISDLQASISDLQVSQCAIEPGYPT